MANQDLTDTDSATLAESGGWATTVRVDSETFVLTDVGVVWKGYDENEALFEVRVLTPIYDVVVEGFEDG